jgi:hypothetical protein
LEKSLETVISCSLPAAMGGMENMNPGSWSGELIDAPGDRGSADFAVVEADIDAAERAWGGRS